MIFTRLVIQIAKANETTTGRKFTPSGNKHKNSCDGDSEHSLHILTPWMLAHSPFLQDEPWSFPWMNQSFPEVSHVAFNSNSHVALPG